MTQGLRKMGDVTHFGWLVIPDSLVKVDGWCFNQFEDSVKNATVYMIKTAWDIVQWAFGLVGLACVDELANAGVAG